MKSISNIIFIWYHEQSMVIRDKGILIFILFVPLVYPLLYSYVYTNEVVRNVPVAVVDDSHSTLSRKFIRKIDASPDVSVSVVCADMQEARLLMKEQKVYGVLHLPSTMTTDISQCKQTYVGLYCDMCSMLYYKAIMLTTTNVSLDVNKNIKIERYLRGTTERQDEITATPILYDYVALYNPQSGFASFLIPPVLMLIIQQTLFLGIGMSMGNAREKYKGSVIPLNRNYRNPIHIVLGKSIFYFLLYVGVAIYMFTAVNRCFSLPCLGDYWIFLLFMIPYLLACIFCAMVLSAFVYRREDCIMLFVFLSVPMLFLSGISWPGAAIPAFWKYVSYLFPSTFGLNGYVRIASMGANLSDVSFEYFGLWIQVIVYFTLACILYGRSIARSLSKEQK